MTRIILEDVRMGYTWTSYIASVEGCLRKAGFWEGETWKLMGSTGIGFHFIIHNEVCPSSVTVYDWASDHLNAMDRIGIHTEVYTCMDIQMNTFSKIQQDSIEKIKQSIQRGQPVVVWAPTPILEFGIIHGFDDDDGVFFVKDCSGQTSDPLLYENLGKSEVPMLCYQLFMGKVAVDQEKVFRDSLNFAISEWEKAFHVSPSYASGRKAYEYLIKALEGGVINDFGLAYNVNVYADSKGCIAKYLQYVMETSTQLKGLEQAVNCFQQIATRFQKLAQLFPFSGSNGSGCTINRANIPEGLTLIKESFELEEDAFRHIKAAVKENG